MNYHESVCEKSSTIGGFMKRILSMVLILIMSVGTMSFSAFAADEESTAKEKWAAAKVTAEVRDDKISVKVSWSKAPDGIKLYKVTAIKNGKTTKTTAEAKEGKKYALLKDLVPGTYTFEVTAYSDEDGKKAVGETKTTDSVVIDEQAPAKPTKLRSYSAYRSIALEWDPCNTADYYVVYRDGKKLAKVSKTSHPYDSKKKIGYIDTKGFDDGYKEVKHTYYVRAFNSQGKSLKSKKVTDSCTRPMYIDCTFYQTKALTSHDGFNKTHTFKYGDKIHSYYYIRGYYYFYYKIGGKNYLFRTHYSRVGNFNAQYTSDFNYTRKEAEYFVNSLPKKYQKSYGSGKKTLIWVNLYTQHLYVFKGSPGKWRINDTIKSKYDKKAVLKDWEIASGKAATPSPGGIELKYKGKYSNIYKKDPTFKGVKDVYRLWCLFHSHSALHGPLNGVYGKPQSGGCIRSPWPKIRFIYYSIPIGTRVIVY